MAGETSSPAQATDDTRRQRSSLAFPYMGLTEAMEVARAIYDHVGSSQCDDAQLAAWLGFSLKSSGYRVRLSTARMFGVIETAAASTYQLSELGLEIVDPEHERGAKVQAFLSVPLFSTVFEKWKGRQLPPAAAMERDLVGLGVPEKQKDRARQVLERSALQAGFFEHGKDRLVKPGVARREAPSPSDDHRGGPRGAGGGGNEPPPCDPIIQSLIARLPRPGTVWKADDRKLWLELLEGSFRLVYKMEAEPEAPRLAPPHRSDVDDAAPANPTPDPGDEMFK